MTPAARYAAAIEILDTILAGTPAEQALTNWARGHRFAGSGDRGAIRDHVFDALRCRGSAAARGGALSGRGLVLGLLRSQGLDPASVFTGDGHAPARLSEAEAADSGIAAPSGLDWPGWLVSELRTDLGPDFDAVSRAMQARAPVFLRVNPVRARVAVAQRMLAEEGILSIPHPLAETALQVTEGARRIAASAAYRDGVVELQDAASQAAVGMIPLAPTARVLDYCAGGGGKALALAARAPAARITAHDADAGRMRDLSARAARAGARIRLARPGAVGGAYDLVLVDAPCSGSGTWRRTPDAKWRLTPARLDDLTALQATILAQAAPHVADGGRLVYMTCSLLRRENEAQVQAFVQKGEWMCETTRRYSPAEGGDGFFAAIFQRL